MHGQQNIKKKLDLFCKILVRLVVLCWYWRIVTR